MHECDAEELKKDLVHAVGVHVCVFHIKSQHMHTLKRKETREVVTTW